MGGGSVSESSDSSEAIEKQIAALQAQIMDLQQSPLPEDAKVAKIGALQGQISALQQQLAQAKLA